MPMTFTIDDNQHAKIAVWIAEVNGRAIEKQKQEMKNPTVFQKMSWEDGRPYYGAIGGNISYIFTPTGLGTILIAKEAITGEELNITNMYKANFDLYAITNEAIYIRDLNCGSMSVTNDAENVVKFLCNKYGNNKRIIYRDSEGIWDELIHENGEFVRFGSLHLIDSAVIYQIEMFKKTQGM